VREDIAKKTSLANANFKYLPSLIAVENGRMNSYKGSEGLTNAMPTPTNISELKTIINKPVILGESANKLSTDNLNNNVKTDNLNNNVKTNNLNANNNSNNNVENNNEVSNNNSRNNNNDNNNLGYNNDEANNRNNDKPSLGFPEEQLTVNNTPLLGKTPSGKVYKPTPQAAPQAGGNALPAAILGSLAMLLKKTRKAKKLIKSRRNK
jgi:hypothetical protein